jgi:hypothetical protein
MVCHYLAYLLLKRPKSVQKKQAFEMLFEQGKKIGRAIGLGCHPIWKNHRTLKRKSSFWRHAIETKFEFKKQES